MIFIIILILVMFIIWTLIMKSNKLTKLDNKIYNELTIKEPYITILKILTNFGSVKFYIPTLTLVLIFSTNKKSVLIFIGFMLGCSLIIEIFKRIIRRERPNIKRLVKEKGFSYPSGHTTSSVCFYGFLLFLTLISNIILPLKLILIIILLAIIITIVEFLD